MQTCLTLELNISIVKLLSKLVISLLIRVQAKLQDAEHFVWRIHGFAVHNFSSPSMIYISDKCKYRSRLSNNFIVYLI